MNGTKLLSSSLRELHVHASLYNLYRSFPVSETQWPGSTSLTEYIGRQLDEEWYLWDLIATTVPLFLFPAQTSAKPSALMGRVPTMVTSPGPKNSQPIGKNGLRSRTASTRSSGSAIGLAMVERSISGRSDSSWTGSSAMHKCISLPSCCTHPSGRVS